MIHSPRGAANPFGLPSGARVRIAVPLHFEPVVVAWGEQVFRLNPNDLGVADFRDLPVRIEGKRLVLERGGGRFVYERIGK